MNRRLVQSIATLLLLGLLAGQAQAVRIGDITRVESQRVNKLHGLGLVVGLNKSGDSGNFMPTIRPLAAMLTRLQNPVTSPLELTAVKNVALVTVTATVPASGVRVGDRIDVQVQSIGDAKSLRGGRLFIVPLQGPQRNSIVYALAEGNVRVEDPSTPTVGVVDGGAVIEEEILMEVVDGRHRFRLVLDDPMADFRMSGAIAEAVNLDARREMEGLPIARALDAKTVEVQVPEEYQKNPVVFLGRVLDIQLLLPNAPARVEINERTGTITISGHVQIAPVVISHSSLVVRTQPVVQAAAGTAGNPVVSTATTSPGTETTFVGVDPRGEGGTMLQDLVDALNVLRVPAKDRIDIIKQLARSGHIRAEVTFAD
jgi:flagellar P-ring protein FlgI